MQPKKIINNPKDVVPGLIDGDLIIVMEDQLSLGMNAMNPFEPPCMNLKEAKQKWGDRICFWGNIDLVNTLGRLSPI